MAQTNSSTSSVTVADPHERDIEAQKMNQKKPSHWQLVIDQTYITAEVLNWPCFFDSNVKDSRTNGLSSFSYGIRRIA